MHINPASRTVRIAPQILAPSDTPRRTGSSSRRVTSSTTRRAISTSGNAQASTKRPAPSPSSTSGKPSSTSSAGSASKTASSSQRSGSLPLSTSRGTSGFTSSIRISTSSRFSASRSIIRSASASAGTGLSENATTQGNNKSFNAAFLALLLLLIFLVLGGILYARRFANRNRSSGDGSKDGHDDYQEKMPLAGAASLSGSSRYPPGNFPTGSRSTGGSEEPALPEAGYAAGARVTQGEQTAQPAKMWDKVSSLARSQIPSSLEASRRASEQGASGFDQDVERAPSLPPPLVAEPITPSKGRTVSRLFTGAKEPKSPKANRSSNTVSAEASSVHSGRRPYGELASSVSADTMAHLMSIAQAKIPGQTQKGPPPLRKRYVNKGTVGQPIVTTPIVPGEMAKLVTPALISVEEARARAAASGTGLPLTERSTVETNSAEGKRRSETVHLPVIQEVPYIPDDSDNDRQVSPTSQAAKISRPTSTVKPPTPLDGRFESEDVRKEGSPFPWAPSPPRIDTPLANELRRNLLSGRPVLESSTSHNQAYRALDVIDPDPGVPKRPKLPGHSLTEPDDTLRAQAEMGHTDLSPLNIKSLPLPSQQSLSTEGGLGQGFSSASSWDVSSGSSGRIARMSSFASRTSGLMWSGSNVDAPQGSLSTGTGPASGGGSHDRSVMQEAKQDDTEEQEDPSTLERKQSGNRRVSGPPHAGHGDRRSTVWSLDSAESNGEGQVQTADTNPVLLAPVSPLRLTPTPTPDRPRRHLPTPPPVQLRRASAHNQDIASTKTSTDIPRSKTTEFGTSRPSPTTAKPERGRMSSITNEIMGYLDDQSKRLVSSCSPSGTAPPIKVDSFILSSTLARSSPIMPTPPSRAELPRSRRISTPRKAVPPAVLEDLELSRDQFRGRKTATPPLALPILQLRTRFSDEIHVIGDPVTGPVPPPRTVPPSSLPSPALRSSSPPREPTEIISPQPISRRGSLLPPSPGALTSAFQAPVDDPVSPPDQATEAPRSVDRDAPKAVQTRDFWRELRKTSVTGYYLQTVQGDVAGENDNTEGEDNLR